MKLNPKVDRERYENHIRTLEVHTGGEYCRVAVDCPETEGSTMIERRQYLEQHYDYLRKALMLEPRGHHDMFGAFLTTPCNEEADFGVFFMDTGEYLNMCGHCTIGVVTGILEGGLMEMHEPETKVILDTPAGIIRTVAECKSGKVTGVRLINVPSFVYKREQKIRCGEKEIVYDICFGGSFFALVDTEKNFDRKVSVDNVKYLKEISGEMLKELHKNVSVQHPELDITTVDLVECYSSPETPDGNMRDMIAFGNAGDPQLDRSPGGTAMSARMALMYAKAELKPGEDFTYESFVGAKFNGKIVEETTVGDYKAVVAEVKGAAYLVGESIWYRDPDDELGKGFTI